METATVKPQVELVGRDGNAFAILGACRAAARRAGWTQEQIVEFTDRATAGDYDALLRVVMTDFDVA